tara:strand:+ start:778 stop:987 length:210 start_codon:yes stop_codon:yes gene_type:complete
MNVVFVLMIITSAGVSEAHTFNSMKDCQAVSQKLKTESFCVEKKPVNIEKEMTSMLTLMRKMVRTLESE